MTNILDSYVAAIGGGLLLVMPAWAGAASIRWF
jgi:hypothetical protein